MFVCVFSVWKGGCYNLWCFKPLTMFVGGVDVCILDLKKKQHVQLINWPSLLHTCDTALRVSFIKLSDIVYCVDLQHYVQIMTSG